MENNNISLANLGTIVIGQTLEIGTSTKAGVTSKANYYRLDSEQKKSIVGARLITSSKDKVDFAVNVKEISNQDLLDILARGITANPDDELSKVSQYIKDCFYATYKEMANQAYNNQSKVIKLELMDCIEFATMERSRTRKAISFTGEYFKLVMPRVMIAMTKFYKESKGKDLPITAAQFLIGQVKLLLTVEQMTPSANQLDLLAGILDSLDETMDNELAVNLAVLIQMKNDLLEIAAEFDC